MSQHAGLNPFRWKQFSLAQQALMIANEMNRARNLFNPYDMAGIKLSLERALALLDLTIAVNFSSCLRKELLRMRELIGGLNISEKIKTGTFKWSSRPCCYLPLKAQSKSHFFRNNKSRKNKTYAG